MFKLRIGVFAIILDKEKRVLLCHRRDYDLWNLPGGGLEKGESPWQGAIRETKEETGFDVEIDRLIGIYYKPDQEEISFSFLCKIVKGKITLNDEADKIEYFNLEEIPENISPKQIERIKDALKGQVKTILKVQQGPSSKKYIKKPENTC